VFVLSPLVHVMVDWQVHHGAQLMVDWSVGSGGGAVVSHRLCILDTYSG
jgi:hypothetical protein